MDSNINLDPSVNYNLLEYELTNAINTNTTTKLVKYNKFKHKNNPWITAGLIKSIKLCSKLHLKSKTLVYLWKSIITLKHSIPTF